MRKDINNNIYSVHDQWIFLLLYPLLAVLVIHIGNDNTLMELLSMPSYYTDLLLSFSLVYLVGFYYRQLFKSIYKKFNWTDQIKAGIKQHFLFGLLIPIIVILIIEGFYVTQLLHIPLRESSILYLELPVIAIFCTLVNLLYAMLYFRKYNLELAQQLKMQPTYVNEVTEFKSNFVVNNGVRSLNIGVDEVAYFKVVEKSTFLITKTDQQYLYESSLEQLMRNVDLQTFFQLNRQMVANKASIKSYSPTDTRKLAITLQPEASEIVYVSKTKASAFLQWLKE